MRIEIIYNGESDRFEVWKIEGSNSVLCWECESAREVEELILLDLKELKMKSQIVDEPLILESKLNYESKSIFK